MASAIDVGDLTSPFDPIHPRYKQEVGRRLAHAATPWYSDYGGVHYSGPRFQDVRPLAIAPEDNRGVKGLVLKFEDGNAAPLPGRRTTCGGGVAGRVPKSAGGESPFAVVDANTGETKRVPFWVDNVGDNGAGRLLLSIPNDVKDVKEVRYAGGVPAVFTVQRPAARGDTDAMPAALRCFDVVTARRVRFVTCRTCGRRGVRTTADMGFTTMLHELPVRDLIQWGRRISRRSTGPRVRAGGATTGAGEGADVGDAPAPDVVDTSGRCDSSYAPAADDDEIITDASDAPRRIVYSSRRMST